MHFKKNSFTDILLVTLLLIQLIILFVFNLTRLSHIADFDSSAAMSQAMEISKQKTLFINNWSYQSTLGLDSLVPLSALLYTFTHNIFLSFGIANCLGTLLFLYIFISTSKMLEINRTITLTGCIFMLTPLSCGMLGYFPMMFVNASYYMMKSLIPILLISVIIRIQKGIFHTRHSLLIMLLMWLSFFTGFSCGLYLLVCAFLPILFAQLINMVNVLSQKTDIKNNPKYKNIIYSFIPSIIAIVLCLCGFIAGKIYYPYSFISNMVLCNVDNFFNNLFKFIIGFFELFGAVAYGEVKVISKEGINILLHLCFAITYLILLFIGCRKIKKNFKKGDNNYFLYFLMIIIFNVFILILTYTTYGSATYEYRYFIIPVIAGIFICSHAIPFLKRNITQYIPDIFMKLIIPLFAVLILITSFTSYIDYWEADNNSENLRALSTSLEERHIEVAYFVDSDPAKETDARILRLFSENVNIVNGNSYNQFNDWGTSTQYFNTDLIESSNFAIITTDNVPPQTNLNLIYSHSIDKYHVYIQKDCANANY